MYIGEENLDDSENFQYLLKIFQDIESNYQIPIIVSTHPRTQKKIDNEIKKNLKLVKFLKPFGFFDYIALQRNAFCTISDSGTITEESSILKFPAINLRNAHERPEGMDYGSVILSGINSKRLIESINLSVKHFDNNKGSFEDIPDYKNLNLSKQAMRIILSNIDVINRDVWKKKI